MLKRKWLEIRTIEKKQFLIEEAEEEMIEKIKISKVKDDEVVKTVCHKLYSACIFTTSRLIFTN